VVVELGSTATVVVGAVNGATVGGTAVEVVVVVPREPAALGQLDPEQGGLGGAAGGRREAHDRVPAELEGRMVGGAFDGHVGEPPR